MPTVVHFHNVKGCIMFSCSGLGRSKGEFLIIITIELIFQMSCILLDFTQNGTSNVLKMEEIKALPTQNKAIKW